MEAAPDAMAGSADPEHTPPEPVTAANDGGGKRRDGWSLFEKVLGVITALLTFATAGLGFVAARTASERDDIQAEANRLSSDLEVTSQERDDLSGDLEAAQQQIADLEQQVAGQTTTTENPSGGDGSEPSPGDEAFLSDLEPVADTGGWDAVRDLNVDGTLYTRGLESSRLGYCGTNGPGIEQEVEYSIGRQYSRLEGAAGLSEESAPDLPVKLEIFGDGRLLWSETLVVGQPQTVDLDVSGVLRLRLLATKQFDDPGGCRYVYAALGDPSLRSS